MNIENLNPENNNSNNLNGVNTNVSPMEPTVTTPNITPPNNGQPQINANNMGANLNSTIVPDNNAQVNSGLNQNANVSSIPMNNMMDLNNNIQMNSGLNQNANIASMSINNSINPQVNQATPINLQPEGVASELPINNEPEPLMGSTLTANTPLVNNPNPPVQSEPNFNNSLNNTIAENPPVFGGVPTPPNAPILSDIPPASKKKKGNKKVLIILLVFILILGIGGGVYYFLNTAKTTAIVVNPILTDWELGVPLSNNASDYADISGVDPASCKVNNNEINKDVMNTYSYSITCPGIDEVKSTLRVRDTKGPNVKLKEVIVKPNTDVLVEDFVSKCEDVSINKECDISINDSSIDLKELLSETGDYDIPLSIKDDFNNETLVTAKLIVDENAPSSFLNCEVTTPFESTTKASVSLTYEYGMSDANDISTAKKVLVYQFDNKTDYDEIKQSYETNNTIDNLSGNVTFDDEHYRVELEVSLNVEDLKTEFNTPNDLKTYEDIAVYHESVNDFCSLP